MPIVRVTKIGKVARTGKAIAYFDNKHGQTDGYLVSDKCNPPREGETIDAKTKSWDYQGKTYWGLDDWKPSPVGAAQRAAVDAPAKALAGWDVQSGDLSRYASNIVASAITAGLVKVPQDIACWAAHAYASGEHLRKGSYLNFSPIDANEFGPDPSTHAGDPGFDEQDLNDRIPF